MMKAEKEEEYRSTNRQWAESNRQTLAVLQSRNIPSANINITVTNINEGVATDTIESRSTADPVNCQAAMQFERQQHQQQTNTSIRLRGTVHVLHLFIPLY